MRAALQLEELADRRLIARWRMGTPPFLQRVLVFLTTIIFLPALSVFLIGIGSGTTAIECARTEKGLDCTVQEGFLFDLYRRPRKAHDVRGARIAESSSDDGETMSKLVLDTATGPVSLEWGSSNFGNSRRNRVVEEFNYLVLRDGSGPLRYSFSKGNIFAGCGILLAAFSLWIVVGNLAHFLFPIFLEIIPHERKVRFRWSLWRPRPIERAFSEIKTIGITQSWGMATFFLQDREKRFLVGKWYGVSEPELEGFVDRALKAMAMEPRTVVREKRETSPLFLRLLAAMKGPELTQLPIRIVHGSERMRQLGVILIPVSLAWLAYEVIELRHGHWSLAEIALPLFLLQAARGLVKRRETLVDAEKVVYVERGLVGKREWSEPLKSYSGLFLEEQASDDAKAYRLMLRHSVNKKRNVLLALLHLPHPEASRKAQELRALLCLPDPTSLPDSRLARK